MQHSSDITSNRKTNESHWLIKNVVNLGYKHNRDLVDPAFLIFLIMKINVCLDICELCRNKFSLLKKYNGDYFKETKRWTAMWTFGMLRETLEEAYTERGSSRPVVQREAVA